MIKFHKKNNYQATLTATRPPGRYGALKLDLNDKVESFQEKPDGDGSWINGGFFVLKPDVIDLIDGDHSSWERRRTKRTCKRSTKCISTMVFG